MNSPNRPEKEGKRASPGGFIPMKWAIFEKKE
jgi:hypothetical protein